MFFHTGPRFHLPAIPTPLQPVPGPTPLMMRSMRTNWKTTPVLKKKGSEAFCTPLLRILSLDAA